MTDYIQLLTTPRKEEIIALRDKHQKLLAQPKKGYLRYRDPFESVNYLKAKTTDVSGDIVRIGSAQDISDEERQKVHKVMHGFMPWRKGPFEVFGINIDAEWRSERKWNRVLKALPDLNGKVIADIGCSNGYYMFRMTAHNPKCVIGFEPYLHHYYTFKTLNSFAGFDNLFIEPFGVEDIGLFENSLDVVFLMGILYHRVSPVEALRDIKNALRPGGYLIVESQGIPGDEPVALFPVDRYAKVPGTYFVPTANCLKNWMVRAGFQDTEIFDRHPMSSKEQRRTEWMDFESYSDFIDPNDPSKTVEGYPAPIRIFLKGSKQKN